MDNVTWFLVFSGVPLLAIAAWVLTRVAKHDDDAEADSDRLEAIQPLRRRRALQLSPRKDRMAS